MAKTQRKAAPARRAGTRKASRRATPDPGQRALRAVRGRWHAALGSLSEAEAELRRKLRALTRETAKRTEALRREGRAWARSADHAVEHALAALNIPSRQEVDRLTRRVEELTRKLDGRRAARAR